MAGKVQAYDQSVKVSRRLQEEAEAGGYKYVSDGNGSPMLIKPGNPVDTTVYEDRPKRAKMIGPNKVVAVGAPRG